MKKEIILGTRGSKLALKQANLVKSELLLKNPSLKIEIKTFKTTGDKIQNRYLSEIGGKVLFTKEIDRALLEGKCDIAVHSCKDIEFPINEKIEISSTLKRDSARDVFFSPKGKRFEDLEEGSVIGTSSIRREIQASKINPKVKFKLIRGNVISRLKKVNSKDYDGTFLAEAALNRLDINTKDFQIFNEDYFIPSACQGIIAIQNLKERKDLKDLLKIINCRDSYKLMELETEILMSLNGDCKTAVGVYSKFIDKENVTITSFVVNKNNECKIIKKRANLKNALEVAKKIGLELKKYKYSIK